MAQKNEFSDQTKKRLTIAFWSFAAFPFVFITGLILLQPESNLPPMEMLDNPPELLASVVYAEDGESELGHYWRVNRTSVEYKEISPFVTDALISTEDERFKEHSGVDFRALGRAVFKAGSAGGASTISQQLAKLLFTLQQRDREQMARLSGEEVSSGSTGKIGRMMKRINEKACENIIATRLEKRYTKEEIITMYLNQFDFLYNAVGIENAAKVYFNKKPIDLTKDEAAILVGMCKNPSLFNPYAYKVKNYRRILAINKGVAPEAITKTEILERRAQDSLRMVERRNQVLMQWLKNSKAENEGLRVKITQEEYDKLKTKPIKVDYQLVDHKQGMAPYFRESLRKEITNVLLQKNEDGSWKHTRSDGMPFDIYSDGLKIYTTIDVNLQKYAEEGVERHLKDNLQPAFNRQNKGLKNWPFTNQINQEQVESIMRSARKVSLRYQKLSALGLSEGEIAKNFNTEVPMSIFSWDGARDTIMTPNDSIRYYKSYLHAGLVSIEPSTGFVKAWVGGANFEHFAFDHVRQGKRQVGSTMKPFVYATAMAMGAVKPCTMFENRAYCVDLQNASGEVDGRWCPKNAGGSEAAAVSASTGLAQSMNNITVGVMSQMGGYAGPRNISKLLKDMDITLRPEDEVPSLCLGITDLSLFEMTAAQSIFANNGIYNRPTTILRIEDRNGNIIYSASSYSKEVLNETVAYETLLMMKRVINGGTGGSLRGGQSWGGVTAPTAGKTGTTQSNSDGWFMGLTPDLVTGVWVGAEDRSVRFRSMDWGQGARMALPIYGYYMQQVYKDPVIAISTSDFRQPDNYDEERMKCNGNEGFTPPEEEEPDLGI
ncbi:MAG: transglycosylase domain-containing protein [Bacteroidota bacterium]